MKRFFASVQKLTAQPETSDPLILSQRTQTLSIWEGSLWAVMWGFGETYIAPFAILLHASNLAMAFEPISTVRILWRLGIGQPLFAQAGEFIKRYSPANGRDSTR